MNKSYEKIKQKFWAWLLTFVKQLQTKIMNKSCEKVVNISFEPKMWAKVVNKKCEQHLLTTVVKNGVNERNFEQKLWTRVVNKFLNNCCELKL